MIRCKFLVLISLLSLFRFQAVFAQKQNPDVAIAQQCINALSDVMIHDITSPPVSSRDYAYTLIAFYEAVRHGDTAYKSYGNKLNGLALLPEPAANVKYDWLTVGTQAFYKTAYTFVFSKEIFKHSWDSIQTRLRKRKIAPEIYRRSIQYGDEVAGHILKWASNDQYSQTRTLPRFTPGQSDSVWKPTGPDYMEAIEPNWNKIRPMTLQAPNQFVVPRPAAYKSEKFMQECKEIYEGSQDISSEESIIANFWDCNPYTTRTVGHLMYSIKKITPGGHWIGITGLAVKKSNQSLAQALQCYSMVSIAIFDGFIAVWDEKYRSTYIRPITAIHQLISPTWEPILQTPPFPEYLSAHSVISMAAAMVLTHLCGDNFHFTDTVEKSFGLKERRFTSFVQAANEAAISRMYGGIHFREAIEKGTDMGREVGNFVLYKLTPLASSN